MKKLILGFFALVSAIALGAGKSYTNSSYVVVTPDTRWADINPTLSISNIAERAGLANTNYVAESVGELSESIGVITENVETLQSDVATNAQNISLLNTQTSVMYQLFSGSNVVLEVTNYNSQVGNSPKMSLLQLTESNTYTTVWTETNNLYKVANSASNYTATIGANLAEYIDSNFAPKGWSARTSGLGAVAPSNETWITTPTLVLSGGLEFKQVTDGGMFFLINNGMNTIATNKFGFMQLSASDGSPIITIAKTDSYYVGVDPDSITTDTSGGTTIASVHIPVVSTDHPYLRYVQTLSRGVAPVWQLEEDGIAGITSTWSGSSGDWICTIESTASSGYFAFEYLQEGSTKIEFGGMVDVNTNGIMCTDGVHSVRPVYNNGNITWEVVE